MFQALWCHLKYAKYAARVLFLHETNLSLWCPISQSVEYLIADPGVVSLIPDRYHTFVEVNHEKFSAVILLLKLIQKGLLNASYMQKYVQRIMANRPGNKCG